MQIPRRSQQRIFPSPAVHREVHWAAVVIGDDDAAAGQDRDKCRSVRQRQIAFDNDVRRGLLDTGGGSRGYVTAGAVCGG